MKVRLVPLQHSIQCKLADWLQSTKLISGLTPIHILGTKFEANPKPLFTYLIEPRSFSASPERNIKENSKANPEAFGFSE